MSRLIPHEPTTASTAIPRPGRTLWPGRSSGRSCGIAIAGVLMFALGAAGCGGASSSTTTTAAAPITKAAFLAKANAICGIADPALSAANLKLTSNPTPASVAAVVKDTYVPSIEAQISGIRALGTPAGDQATVTRMLQLVQADLDKIKGDPGLITTDVFGDFAKVAHPYGLTSCAPLS
jgi:hypothetical protein